jgi:hypothetical protein
MTSNWNRRFPNPHTRPDPGDPLTARLREDSKRLFGFDPLVSAVSTAGILEDIRARMDTPEYRSGVADYEAEEARRAETQAGIEYRRRLERLSPFHVRSVLAGCDAELNPITSTDLQRKVIAQWSGQESMFLLGETGVGKTYTATWCAMRAAKRGVDVACTTATRVAESSFEGLLTLRGAGLLVLDQLHTLRSPTGREMPAWKVAPVIDLIDYRYEQELVTIAAGTVAPEEMFDIIGHDVRRRFPLRLQSNTTEIRGR